MAVLTRTVGRPLTLAALALAAAMMAVLIGTGSLRGAARDQDQAGAGRGCVGAFGAGDSTLRLAAAGRSREVLLHVPSVLVRAGGRAQLLVALHGWSSGAREFSAVTGLSAGADSSGVIVAYPQGLGTPAGWHFSGNPSPDRGAAAAGDWPAWQ